ncbi:MAG: hypothetical protein IKS48_07275 [Eubacterium sp.]|nr:hypothetical protein [Eubacterium sp.]
MTPLFDDGPVYDPHVKSIINYMLIHLRNNNPKPESPVYARNAAFIKELYDGTFLRHNFVYSRINQFDLDRVNEQVKAVKGSWQMVRNIVIGSLDHYELAKSKDRMPFNKKFLDDISFATFFEGSVKFNPDGCFDSNFMKFVNEPKMSYNYNSDITIGKLKDETNALFRKEAESFCNKWFKMKHMQLSFWYEMVDWTRWLRCFRKTFPNIYGEFIASCEDGNPFIDFKRFLLDRLKWKEGENPVMNVYYFRLTRYDSGMLDGMFKEWLRTGIDRNKFNALKQLPKSIDRYYTDESFSKPEEKVEKKVVDVEDLPIF